MQLHMHNGELYAKDGDRLEPLTNIEVLDSHISEPDPDLQVTCIVRLFAHRDSPKKGQDQCPV